MTGRTRRTAAQARVPPATPFAAAHRGLSAEVVENTFAAFEAAVDAGFTAIETDLRLTGDDEVVLLHDAGLERTTGANGRVADMNYDEVRGHVTEAGPIPRLDDVLAAFPDVHWLLECKDVAVVRPALDLVRHHDAHVMVSAMDPRALRTAREADPDVPRGLIVVGALDDMDIAEANHLECTWLNADARALRREHADMVHDAGLCLGAWTVNEPADAQRLLSWGTDCIITDVRDVLDAVRLA